MPNAVDDASKAKLDAKVRKRGREEIHEQELEEYRKRRIMTNDPLLRMGKDELVH